jgi:acyl-CoA dehydrogenase
MVSFTPTEEQQLLIDTIRKYSEKTVRPTAHDADESRTIAPNVLAQGWQLGLVPSGIPEELGGFGELNAITSVLALEELAFGDLSAALAINTPALMAYPLVLYGTAEQRQQLLPMFLEEKFTPATAALLEPGMFFDPHDLKTQASPADHGYTLNGTKAFVPLADSATHLMIYARNTTNGNTEAFVVARSADGLTIESRETLMGVRALPMFRVHLNNVAVKAEMRLGGSVGIDYARLLSRQQVALGALAVGVGRSALEYACEYAKQRVAFGKPIAQKQSIAFLLAEMAIEIDGARLLVWEAAAKLDKGEDASKEAYLAKQYADKASLFATDSAVQTLGGYGFIREYPAERWLRNARGFATFHGLAIA